MDYICLSAAALRLKKPPTTTRKSINTCYSQIRSYLGSKVPAGKVKTKPPVSLSASAASFLPAPGNTGGCLIFFFTYFGLFHLGLSWSGPSTAAVTWQPGLGAPGAERPRSRLGERSGPGPGPGPGAKRSGPSGPAVPGPRLPPAALPP